MEGPLFSLRSTTKKKVKEAIRSAGWLVRRLSPGEAKQLAWLRNMSIHTVLDIGANVGQFALSISEILPQARIISFEPLPDCHMELLSRMGHHSDFRAFNFALGSREEETTIHRSVSSPSSSLLPMGPLHERAFPHTCGTHVDRVRVRRLDDLRPELGELGLLLVKIDVQGFERDVIEGGRRTISEASVLIIEVSFRELYIGQPLFGEIFATVSALGFVYAGNLEQLYDPANGRVLQADAIFLREVAL